MNNKHMRNYEDSNNDEIKTRSKNSAKTTKASSSQSSKKGSKGKKQLKKKHKILKRVLLLILAILIVIAGIITYKTVRNGGGLSGFLATMVGHNENTKKNLSEIQILVMGESLRLTDTIMVCSYNPNTQKASMMSVPRDTFIGKNQKKATAYDKINSLYQGKYPEKTLKAINEITGLNIQYYVVIDTDALKELVDAIGGVDFYVPIDMNYDDTSEENFIQIHLKQGQQRLNGSQAEQLVRFRHNTDGSTYPSSYGEQDIGRMRTQREFISAVLKQTLKPSNVLKLGEFIDIANKNVKTNLPISVAKDYIPYAVEFSTDNIKTETLPGTPKLLNGVWVYLTDDSKTQSIVSELFFDGTTEDNINEQMPKVQILNGSEDANNLTKIVAKLKEKGYNVVKVGNTKTATKTTIINRTKQSTDTATALKDVIGIGTISSGKDTEKVDFTITIGKDYK